MKSIILHKYFEKKYSKLSQKVKDAFRKRKNLFLEDENSLLLGMHSLHGKYAGYKSFNVTGDIRAVYKEIEEGTFLFC